MACALVMCVVGGAANDVVGTAVPLCEGGTVEWSCDVRGAQQQRVACVRVLSRKSASFVSKSGFT